MLGKTNAINKKTVLEELTVTAGTENKELAAEDGKGYSKVTVSPTPSQEKTVTPGASQKTVSPDVGKLLSKVIVSGDTDLIARNIRKAVDIFGVTGTLEEGINLPRLSGLSKIAVNEFTPSQDTDASALKQSHSLGEIPKIALILSKKFENPANSELIFMATENMNQQSGEANNSISCFESSWGGALTSGRASLYASYVQLGAGSGYKYAAGTTYTLITMA